MQTYTDKTSENKIHSNHTPSSKGGDPGAFQFADQRGAFTAQLKLQGMADNYSNGNGVVQRVVVLHAGSASTPTAAAVPAVRTSTNFETSHITTADVTDELARTKMQERGVLRSTLVKQAAFERVVGANLTAIRTAATNDTGVRYSGFGTTEARTATERGVFHAPEIEIKSRVSGPNVIEIHHLHDAEARLTFATGNSWGSRLPFGPGAPTKMGTSSASTGSGKLPAPPKPTVGTGVPVTPPAKRVVTTS